ncbi:hypothetical protein [Pseudaminobacter soli (ex Li et al. 2025)]|uniref:hypothetical protein n=1 Tax=Pseudaminobacter soli (ex Li et al. 2025) TaxID=1295366 RepID=UPI0024732E8B|nr:hypothetical protein [Mesorhizobium soli]
MAALAGLLFVALSIKIDVIRQVPRWRTRAFGNIFAFVGLLIESALVMMPQPSAWLALEIIVLNAFLLLFVPVRAVIDLWRQHDPIPLPRMLTGMALWSLGALGGFSLLIGAGGGMYLVAGAFLGLIWLGVLNAWSFITVDDV